MTLQPPSANPLQDAANRSTKRTPRKDAYCFTLRGKIPLDMTNADSLAGAIKAVAGIKDTLPAGSTVELTASLGKI